MLAVAIAASFPLILHLARGTTFSIDELDWFMTSPGLDPERALEPHGGHLVFTTRLVSKVVLEAFGSSYAPFLLLTTATVAGLATLFFVYARRRVGAVAALAPVLVLLFFGSDTDHVATGNGFTVLLALACGVGALLGLERDDRRGDVAACALLCLGVITYTVALAFVAGAAVLVLLRGDRWRRAWIFAVPVAVYLGWFLWALGAAEDPESRTALSNALLFPSWAFQSLSTALGALVGLDYDFGAEAATVGPVLALLAIGGLVWRLRRGAVPPALWGTLAVILALWMMGALAAGPLREPGDPRYLYPVTIGVLLVAAWAASGLRWTRRGLIALYVVAAIGLVGNLSLLRERTADLRVVHEATRAELTALDIAGEWADPDFNPREAAAETTLLAFPYATLRPRGESPTKLYLTASQRYGPLGFAPDDLRDQRDALRARTDIFLVTALGLELRPIGGPDPQNCLEVEAEPDEQIQFELPPGSAAVLQPRGGDGPVALRRFGDQTGVDIGELHSGEAALLDLPDDRVPDAWEVSAPGSSLLVCPLR